MPTATYTAMDEPTIVYSGWEAWLIPCAQQSTEAVAPVVIRNVGDTKCALNDVHSWDGVTIRVQAAPSVWGPAEGSKFVRIDGFSAD